MQAKGEIPVLLMDLLNDFLRLVVEVRDLVEGLVEYEPLTMSCLLLRFHRIQNAMRNVSITYNQRKEHLKVAFGFETQYIKL